MPDLPIRSLSDVPSPASLPALFSCHRGDVVRVLGINAVIGFALWVLTRTDLLNNLIYSNCIGLSIFSLSVWLSYRFGEAPPGRRALLIAVPVGSLIGIVLGSQICSDHYLGFLMTRPRYLLASVVVTMIIGASVSYYFYARSQLMERTAQLQGARAAEAAAAILVSESRLRTLQAQIEPHFLFNTLSTVIGLVDDRPADAKRMLVDLTQLLRRTLQRSRVDSIALAQEISHIRAYLDIQAMRLGPRLHYEIHVPPQTEDFSLAPYLLQPLVENAILHGIEPCIEGGTVSICAQVRDDALIIDVTDTGLGLRGDKPSGMALANIRARLESLHGGRSSLILLPNQPSGVIARLTLPWKQAGSPVTTETGP